uniref:C2 domain-containing protein n=1 Tax=Macrostomum lignano TaxID=282301 RepID=A0A1I8IA64_9PLAT
PVVRAPKSNNSTAATPAAATPTTTVQSVSDKFEDRGLGQLHFVLQFIPGKATLYIRIIKGECLAAQDSNGLSDPYVKVHLLPDTGKRTKLRTRTCQRTLNPIWDEEFCYSGVSRSDMETKMLTVLDEDTIGFDWMGEILLLSATCCTGRPKEGRGKIMIGLCYAPAKSELTVRVIQCVNLIAMDAPMATAIRSLS